jgi:tetratricopeptide (TPR) repeat protein
MAEDEAGTGGGLLAYGEELIARKQYAEAATMLERAAELAPEDWRVWAQLGLTYVDSDRETKRAGKAVAPFERALALESSVAWVWVKYASALIYARRPEDALAACERALALEPENAMAHLDAGIALRMLKRYDESLAALESSRTYDPTYVKAWIGLATTLHALGRDTEAIALLDDAARLLPDDGSLLSGRSQLLARMGRQADALKAAVRARTLDPGTARFWAVEARALSGLKRDAEADAACERALMLEPNELTALSVRGALHLRAGRYDDAARVYAQLVSLLPEMAALWDGLGSTLDLAHRPQDARTAYRRAGELRKEARAAAKAARASKRGRPSFLRRIFRR